MGGWVGGWESFTSGFVGVVVFHPILGREEDEIEDVTQMRAEVGGVDEAGAGEGLVEEVGGWVG